MAHKRHWGSTDVWLHGHVVERRRRDGRLVARVILHHTYYVAWFVYTPLGKVFKRGATATIASAQGEVDALLDFVAGCDAGSSNCDPRLAG